MIRGAFTSTEIKVENITKSRVKEMTFGDSVILHLKLGEKVTECHLLYPGFSDIFTLYVCAHVLMLLCLAHKRLYVWQYSIGTLPVTLYYAYTDLTLSGKLINISGSEPPLIVISSCVSSRRYKIGPVCQLVWPLTAEPFDLASRNLAQILISH